jgi:hypothetical protein
MTPTRTAGCCLGGGGAGLADADCRRIAGPGGEISARAGALSGGSSAGRVLPLHPRARPRLRSPRHRHCPQHSRSPLLHPGPPQRRPPPGQAGPRHPRAPPRPRASHDAAQPRPRRAAPAPAGRLIPYTLLPVSQSLTPCLPKAGPGYSPLCPVGGPSRLAGAQGSRCPHLPAHQPRRTGPCSSSTLVAIPLLISNSGSSSSTISASGPTACSVPLHLNHSLAGFRSCARLRSGPPTDSNHAVGTAWSWSSMVSAGQLLHEKPGGTSIGDRPQPAVSAWKAGAQRQAGLPRSRTVARHR